LNIAEAWRLSETPYKELTYRSAVMTRGSSRSGLGRTSSPTAMVKSIMRGALVSKVVFTLFIGLGTVFTFSQYVATPTPAALVSGVTFSLAITLAYLVLYSLQVLPSFSSAEPYVLLSTLPLSEQDVSLVTVLSIVRTFDSIALVAIVAQVAMVAYLTLSALGAIAMALASVANAVFGVTISLWLSGVFQKNISRGGRGKGASVARFIFLLSWGLAAASLGFLFNLVTYVVPLLDSAVSGALASTSIPLLFSLVHPFTEGLVVASLVFPSFQTVSPSLGLASVLSFFVLAGYLVLAVLAARKTLSLAASVSRGPTVAVVRQRATEFLLRLRKPIPAYVVKDIRVSSKNPSTAFIFALPVLETIVIALTLTGINSLRAYSVLTSTALGCFFTLISASILLNTEGSGLDYTLSLPLRARVMVIAKSLIATVAYTPVPAAVAVLLLLGKPADLWLVAIPVLEIAAVSAATSAELTFFIQGYRKAGTRQTSRSIETRGLNLMSAGDLFRLGAALIVAGCLVLAPLGAYVAAYVLTFSHALALTSLALVALVELGGVQLYLRRS
jgi:predicted permease